MAGVAVIVDLHGISAGGVAIELIEVGELAGIVSRDGIESWRVRTISGDDGGIRPDHHNIQDLSTRIVDTFDFDKIEPAVAGLVGTDREVGAREDLNDAKEEHA